MKQIKLYALILFVIGLMVTISSCTKEPTSPSDTTTNDKFSSNDFELIVMDNTESDIGDGDESNMIIMLPAYGYSDEDNESMGWHDNGNHYGWYKHKFMKEKKSYRLHLGFILRRLNNKFAFDSTQIDSIKIYIKENVECVKTQMQILRDSEKGIIDSANKERLRLIDSSKSQGWTYEQLKDSLKSLNLRTRQALKDNPVRLEVCLAIKACREDLFSKIELILTPEQYLIWLEWKSKLKEINCGD